MEENLSTLYKYLSIIITIIIYPPILLYYKIKSGLEQLEQFFFKPKIKEGIFKRVGRAVKRTTKQFARGTVSVADKVKKEAERKAREAAEAAKRAKEEAERKAREAAEAAKRAKEEAERKAREAAAAAEKAAREAAEAAKRAAEALARELNKIFGEIKKTEKKITDTVNKANNVSKKVGDTLNKSNSVIRKVKNVPNDTINYTNNYIAAPIRNASNRMYSALNKLNDVKEETEDLNKELNNAFNYLNSLPTLINNFVNSIIVQPMKVVANNIISILNKIKEFNNTLSKIGKQLNNAFNYLNSVPTLINNFVNSIIVQPMKVVANKIISILNKIKGFFVSLEIIGDKLNEAARFISTIPEQIKNFCEFIFVEKIGGIFAQIGDMLNFVIIEPIFDLILAFVGVIIGILNILIKIIEKLITLPGCSLHYLFDGFSNLFKLFMPNWLYSLMKTICSLFYYVILYPMLLVLDFVLKLFGSKGMFHYLSSGDCFKFNVMSDLNHIKNGFVKAGNTFGNQFGRFDKFKFKI